MSLTKEVGLIYNIYFHYLVFTFLNNNKFRLYFVPLIFDQFNFILIPSIFLFCFKRKNLNILSNMKINESNTILLL